MLASHSVLLGVSFPASSSSNWKGINHPELSAKKGGSGLCAGKRTVNIVGTKQAGVLAPEESSEHLASVPRGPPAED